MRRPTKWREQFIADMAREGQSINTARAFLRVGATLQRLAEAQCNGDWPADNGENGSKPCSQCESMWHPPGLRKDGRCLDCHATDRARAIQVKLLPPDWVIEFQGDPRGCVIKLKTPGGREIGVP